MRTDLAKESRMVIPALSGIREQTEIKDGVEILRIDVLTDEASRKLDKPIGRYISVTTTKAAMMDRTEREKLAGILAHELVSLADRKNNALIIGLGNRYIAADALGTKTAEHVFVTRHIHMHMKDVLPPETPVVSAFCANVLGMTGLETIEVVTALVQRIKPEIVILIDSLAASQPEHLGCVIQCNDSGISPGAGVGNYRAILSKDTMNVPVIAIGMPLVVSAEAIVKNIDCSQKENSTYRDMIVTPKEIDAMVKDASRVLSDAINRMLFGENYTEIEKLLR